MLTLFEIGYLETNKTGKAGKIWQIIVLIWLNIVLSYLKIQFMKDRIKLNQFVIYKINFNKIPENSKSKKKSNYAGED